MTAPEASTEWAVEVGCDGRWHECTGPISDRAEALERLDWYRRMAAASVSYRLARITTAVTRAIEDV